MATLGPQDGERIQGTTYRQRKRNNRFSQVKTSGIHIPLFVEIETEPHCYRSVAPSFSTFAVASTFSTPHAKGRTENPDN